LRPASTFPRHPDQAKGLSLGVSFTRYPRLYHMAEGGSWQSIRQRGLLSSSALLDLYEVQGDLRDRLESRHRPEKYTIAHPLHGEAVLRDQKPMSDATLRDCLQDGLCPADWYRLLNRKVFFWLTEARLLTLLNAKAYRNDVHDVLTVSTAELLERYSATVSLSPMNSGNSVPWKHPRGLATFLPIADYPFAERRKYRDNSVVELTVDYAVPDVADFILSVDQRRGTQLIANIYAQ
jgi:hypothetical protein